MNILEVETLARKVLNFQFVYDENSEEQLLAVKQQLKETSLENIEKMLVLTRIQHFMEMKEMKKRIYEMNKKVENEQENLKMTINGIIEYLKKQTHATVVVLLIVFALISDFIGAIALIIPQNLVAGSVFGGIIAAAIVICIIQAYKHHTSKVLQVDNV